MTFTYCCKGPGENGRGCDATVWAGREGPYCPRCQQQRSHADQTNQTNQTTPATPEGGE